MNEPQQAHPATFLDTLKYAMEGHAQELAVIYHLWSIVPNGEDEIITQSVDYALKAMGGAYDPRSVDADVEHVKASIKGFDSSRTRRNVLIIVCMLALFQRAVKYAEHVASTRSTDAVVARRLSLMRQRTVVNVIQGALRKANLRIDFPALWDTRSREIQSAAHLLFNVNVISVWATHHGKHTQVMAVFTAEEIGRMMAEK